MIERLAPKLAGRATVCRLNLDAGAETAERYGIDSCPILLILKDGKEVNRLVGVRGEREIIEAVEKCFAGDQDGTT